MARIGLGAGSRAAPTLDAELGLRAAGFSRVAGVDEVGRGAWAGPLVAAAVVLPDPREGVPPVLDGVRDSKALSPDERAALFEPIVSRALSVGIGAVPAVELDLVGLAAANRLAMIRAVRALAPGADHLLIDGFGLPGCAIAQTAVVHGDALCVSIAAASIVAKVVRDRWMAEFHVQCPAYDWARNKGYGTRAHRDGLARHGITALHRRSFAPIATLLEGSQR